jgi:hypothetical protein
MQANHFRRRSNFYDYVCKLSHFPEFTRANVRPNILFEITYNHVKKRTYETYNADKKVTRQSEKKKKNIIYYGTIASGN